MNLYQYEHFMGPRRHKMSPERLHNLLHQVNYRYSRLSPANCSKNMLAVHSNIDSEIEFAKLQISTPRVRFSLSPSSLPLINSPSKGSYVKPRQHPSEKEFYKTKLSVSPLLQAKSSRLRRIEKIIRTCKGLESETTIKNHKTEKSLMKNRSYYGSVVKILDNKGSIMSGLLERCKEYGKVRDNEDTTTKTAKALKRGKKVWKQNHVAFMKSIERMVYSFH